MDGDKGEMGFPLMGDLSPTSQYPTLLRTLGQWSPGNLAVLIYVDLRNVGDINRLAGPVEGDRVIRRVEQLLITWGAGAAVTGRLWSNEFIAA